MKVLIAVEPLALFRVMELLLGEASQIQVLARPDDASSLQREVKRLQPDVLITNARLLGDEARAVLTNVRRLSPRSKIILTDFDANLATLADQCGVDIYLREEMLVRRLLKDVRRLTLERGPSAASRAAARKSSRRPAGKRAE